MVVLVEKAIFEVAAKEPLHQVLVAVAIRQIPHLAHPRANARAILVLFESIDTVVCRVQSLDAVLCAPYDVAAAQVAAMNLAGYGCMVR